MSFGAAMTTRAQASAHIRIACFTVGLGLRGSHPSRFLLEAERHAELHNPRQDDDIGRGGLARERGKKVGPDRTTHCLMVLTFIALKISTRSSSERAPPRRESLRRTEVQEVGTGRRRCRGARRSTRSIESCRPPVKSTCRACGAPLRMLEVRRRDNLEREGIRTRKLARPLPRAVGRVEVGVGIRGQRAVWRFVGPQ